MEDVKQQKWVEFCKKYKTRIMAMRQEKGRTTVPAIWNPQTQEWSWVSREARRKARKALKLRRDKR